ncbi:MAG: DNA-3-methyladenine glycosylase 2 family protein [Gammaproteobacteria bacterium]|nr:DNA-3-methyladenine glycosylase 2 family protein [Gammaproteobacteria bacterium]
MILDTDACYRAVRARDRRFDGRFFTAVASTGIYCRPICPVRIPSENMRFYSSAAAAEGAGFRPCLRCRPERAPGLAMVDATSRLAGAAIARIEEHAVSNGKLADLAAALGVSDRHLRRVTEAELGVAPIELAQTQRLLLAKRLLSETSLKLAEIAFASGFGSMRRFNALFKSRYGLNPGSIRRSSGETPGLKCQLDFRPPFAWQSMLAYLRQRAIPRVETVDSTHYRRTAALAERRGWIAVSLAKSGTALEVEISAALAPVIGAVIARVKQLFDLSAAPEAVATLLTRDPMLEPIVKRLPGLRLPGAFDGFELAVRAVLGQQVSVKAASTLAGRWASKFGTPIETPWAGLDRIAPGAELMRDVATGELRALGVVGSRAHCLRTLAHAVADRRVDLSCAANVEEQIESLTALPGIGPWTAQYIVMRALHWPDAFPDGDLGLLRATNLERRELRARAEVWRPWRAYAAHYLWQSSGVVP